MEPTSSQRTAIESKNPKILVSAGAGSGKTAVLSSRVVKLVEEGTPISAFLIVTFTKAAASEMRVRIQKKLRESEVPFAREQAENIESASITTLHGFASKILKQYFFEVGVDPAFSVLDDGTAKAQKLEAMESVMRKLALEKNEEFFDLVDVFSQNRKDAPLVEAVLSLDEFLCSLEDPDEFLKKAQEAYEKPLQESGATKFMIEESARRAQFFKNKLDVLMSECNLKHASKLVDALAEVEMNLLRIKSGNTLSQMRVALLSYSAPSRAQQKDCEELAEKVKLLKNSVKKFFDMLSEMFCVSKSEEEQKEEFEISQKRVLSLISLCKLFEAEYQKRKDEIGALDFSDLERKLFELLKNESARIAVSKEFKYVFVDEFQDTNRLQDAIYKSLSGINSFFVGDVKQSIYGFRLAEPKIFQEVRDDFRKNGGEVVTLSENFRSHEGIIEFTNKLFETVMTTDVGGENYAVEGKMEKGGKTFEEQSDEKSEFPRVLVCSIKKAKQAEKTERNLPIYSVQNHTNSADEKISSAIAEGRMLVKVLKNLDGKKIFDAASGKMRMIEAKDIAVLSSSRGEYLKTLLRAAEEQGYSFSTDISNDIFEDPDMLSILSVLEIVSNPKQDIPLVTALGSCFVGLSANDMAKIKLFAGKNATHFFETIQNFIEKEPQSDMKGIWQNVQNFFKLVSELRFASSHMGVVELVSYLCQKTDFVSKISQKKNGDQKLYLLETLKEKLLSLGFSDLDEFLRYQKEVGIFVDGGIPATRGIAMQDTDGNVVSTFQNITVTTIHKSKGLEFPVVILVGAGRAFNRDDLSKDFMLSRNFGVGISSFDTMQRLKSGNLVKSAIKLDLQKSLLEEDIRLLYVAVTRAVNHLVVIGVGDPTADETKEKNLLSSSSFFDILSKFDFEENRSLVRVLKDSFEMLSQKEIVVAQAQVFNLPHNDKLVDEMKQALLWKYPHAEATTLAQKYSVTEIAQMDFVKEVVPIADESSTEIGNAYHHIMQYISFDACSDDAFAQEKARLIADGLVLKEEWDLVDEEKIKNCLASPLFVVLAKNKRKILREQEFLFEEKATTLGLSKTCEDKVLVQGVFDVVVFDGEKVLVLDYKTGGAKDDETLIKKHKRQMELYKIAAEKAFGKAVCVAIYSFDMQRMVKVFC